MLNALDISVTPQALQKGEVPVGCVVVRDGVVISSGHNLTNEAMDATRHAEMIAIASLCQTSATGPPFLSRCCLYVTCEPCIMCAAAISMQGVERVVYGCANDKFGGTGSIMNFHESLQVDGHPWNGYEVISGFKRDDSIQLFKQFYARSNQRAPVPKKRREGEHQSSSAQDAAEYPNPPQQDPESAGALNTEG